MLEGFLVLVFFLVFYAVWQFAMWVFCEEVHYIRYIRGEGFVDVPEGYRRNSYWDYLLMNFD